MGDLGFGKSFHMLESGEAHWAIKLLNDAQAAAGHALPVWFTRLLKHWPNLLKDYFRFVKYCAQQVEDRIIMQGKQKDPDITHTLIEDFNKRDPAERQLARQMLYMDSKLIIVAGSDTTAATLAYLFYYLAVTPGLIQRLREEFDQLRQEEEGELDDRKLQRATLLNGCINEALRLNPPVPSGVYRKTPPEGLYIGQTYILGNTTIQMPSYAMARGTFLSPSRYGRKAGH
jgi:tryprostatin B 6-hydroxylase